MLAMRIQALWVEHPTRHADFRGCRGPNARDEDKCIVGQEFQLDRDRPTGIPTNVAFMYDDI